MEMRKPGIRCFDPLSPEAAAGVFLTLRWIVLVIAAKVFLPTIEDSSAPMLVDSLLILMVVVTYGLYIKSSLLFIISLPIQIVMSGGFSAYCFFKVYSFSGKWIYVMLSLTHLLIVTVICFYDIYVSVVCVEKFHEAAVAEIDAEKRVICRRSPNAALINVFRRRLLASPNSTIIETPRSRASMDGSFGELSFLEATKFEGRRLI